MISNPIPWPNGARCACAISFDMDADSLIHIARPKDRLTRRSDMSDNGQGEVVLPLWAFDLRAIL